MPYPLTIFIFLAYFMNFGTPHSNQKKDTLPRIIATYNKQKIYDEVITRAGVRQVHTIEIDTLSKGIFFYFKACLQVQLTSFEIQIRSQDSLILATKRTGNAAFISLAAFNQHIKTGKNHQLYVSLEKDPFVHFMNLRINHIAALAPKPHSEFKFKMDTTTPFYWKDTRKK